MSDTIRISSLDGLFACPPSKLGEGLAVSSAGAEAELGKAVHGVLGSFVTGGKLDVKGECQRRGVEEEGEVAELVTQGVRAWEDIKRYMPAPRAEMRIQTGRLEGTKYSLRGTVDVLSQPAPKKVIYADWKSGYLDDGYAQQMAGYAFACWDYLGRPEDIEIMGIVVFLRHRYYRPVRWTAEKLREWEYDLTHNVLGAPGTYRVGQHCGKCERYHSCEARRASVGGTVAALVTPQLLPADDPYRAMLAKAEQLFAGITPENKGEPEVAELVSELRFRRSLVMKALDELVELERRAVERVGPIPLGNDRQLIRRQIQQKTIDPLKALKVLRQHLADSEVAEAMKISLPKVKALKAGHYTRGEKGAAMELIEKELEAAGALNVAVAYRLEEQEIPDGEGSNTEERRALPGDGQHPAPGPPDVRAQQSDAG